MSSQKEHKTELKSLFLNFFRERGHRVIPSSPLLPSDPSLLFTTAGMLQFKEMFLQHPSELEYSRAVSCQRCLRTTDLEQIGKTARHLSYFEMLGNFSFGDYFKKEAIEWAWQFSIDELRLDPKRIYISVFIDDEEAYALWNKHIGIPSARIVRLDDNFWGPTGAEGPCGPCTELYYDVGESFGRDGDTVGSDNNRYLEYWNLVFNQFYQNTDGTRKELPHKGVDTGAGLERLSVITEGVSSVFETQFFQPFIERAWPTSQEGHPLETASRPAPIHQKHMYILADHIRAINFALSENILPSNQERGYVIRRLLRRTMLSVRKLGLWDKFSELNKELHKLYPELKEHSKKILEIIDIETKAFEKPLTAGETYIKKLIYSHVKDTIKDTANAISAYINTAGLSFTRSTTGLYQDNDAGWFINVQHNAEQFATIYSEFKKQRAYLHDSIVAWTQGNVQHNAEHFTTLDSESKKQRAHLHDSSDTQTQGNVQHNAEHFATLDSESEKQRAHLHDSSDTQTPGSLHDYANFTDKSVLSLYEENLKELASSTQDIYNKYVKQEHLIFEESLYHSNKDIALDKLNLTYVTAKQTNKLLDDILSKIIEIHNSFKVKNEYTEKIRSNLLCIYETYKNAKLHFEQTSQSYPSGMPRDKILDEIKNSNFWKDVLKKRIRNSEETLSNLSDVLLQEVLHSCRDLKHLQELRKAIFRCSLQGVEKLVRAELQELSERKKEFVIPDETVFMLYDSLGFPFELTEELAQIEGFSVNKEAFEKLLEKQRQTSLHSSHNKTTQFNAQDFTDLSDYTETSIETLKELLKESIQGFTHAHNEPYQTNLNASQQKTIKALVSNKYNKVRIIKIQHDPVMYLVGSPNATQTEVEGNLFLTEEGYQTLSTERHKCKALVLDVIPYTQYLKYNTASAQTQAYSIHQDYKSFTHDKKDKEEERGYSAQDVYVVRTNRTPFYAEAGGQVGDSGFLTGSSVEARVIDTQKYVYKADLDPLFQPSNDSQITQTLHADELYTEANGKYKRVRVRKGQEEETFRCVHDSVAVSEHVILMGHIVVVEKGEIRRGDIIELTVDTDRKKQIAHNHSAVHLVHHALHKHLGAHVRQMGSHVSEKRFRFDFAHFRAMTEEEIQKVEQEVLRIICNNHTTQIKRVQHTDALQTQAKAFFKDKYANTNEVSIAFTGQTISVQLNEDGTAKTQHLPDDWNYERNKSPKVRVVQIGETLELCGGTHSTDSGSLMCVKILSETSVAQGVRRIEGIAGQEAIQFFSTLYTHYKELGKKFNISFTGHNLSDSCHAIDQEVHKLLTDNTGHKKEIKRLEAQILAHEIEGQTQHLQKVGDINYLYLLLKDKSEEELKQSNKILQRRIQGDFINLLISKSPSTILYVISVSKGLTSKKPAITIASLINGILESKGGGSAAYASGKLKTENASAVSEKIQKAILEVYKYIEGE